VSSGVALFAATSVRNEAMNSRRFIFAVYKASFAVFSV
jgi:hypothetical protein